MIRELGTQAYSALRHNKRRSILTMLGMAWGIATVVLLLAYGAGFERGLWSAFRSSAPTWSSFSRTHLACRRAAPRREARSDSPSRIWITSATEVPFLKRLSPEVFKQCTVA